MRDGLANMNVSPKGKKAKMAPYQGLFFFGSSNFSLPASSNEKILCTLCLRRQDRDLGFLIPLVAAGLKIQVFCRTVDIMNMASKF